jgi:hypothetical protein
VACPHRPDDTDGHEGHEYSVHIHGDILPEISMNEGHPVDRKADQKADETNKEVSHFHTPIYHGAEEFKEQAGAVATKNSYRNLKCRI